MLNVIMHNTELGTARVSLYINPDTNHWFATAVTAHGILRVDLLLLTKQRSLNQTILLY